MMLNFSLDTKDNKKIRPLCIKLPKKSKYINSVEETKYKSLRSETMNC